MHIRDVREASVRVYETVGCSEPFRVDVNIVLQHECQRDHLKDFGGAEDDNFVPLWLPEVVGDLLQAQETVDLESQT